MRERKEQTNGGTNASARNEKKHAITDVAKDHMRTNGWMRKENEKLKWNVVKKTRVKIIMVK